MDFWSIEIPVPVALAIIAAVGYIVSLQSKAKATDIAMRSRRELKRAQLVANELEKIAWTVRQSLAKHHDSVSRFKERVSRMSSHQQDADWKELCREAEDILKPTLQLATQIANAYDEIRQQSSNLMTFTEVRIDPLTGVNNRRGMDDALNGQFALMARYNAVFSLAMIDVDHFKQVNDQQGHLYGDRVLQELGRLFDESIRETDFVARYGGEEFVVIMPHTELAGACTIIERLRTIVENRLGITFSAGVSSAQDGDYPESLLARADEALYSAKSAGRNRVYCDRVDGAEPIPAEVEIAASPV